jgi:hypothetical protein
LVLLSLKLNQPASHPTHSNHRSSSLFIFISSWFCSSSCICWWGSWVLFLNMAESLDDGEFWLPPQFLTDDMFMDKEKNNQKSNNNTMKTVKDGFALETDIFKNFFPFELGSFGVSSDLCSPVESVSTEESDEEDYIAGITCKMARSSLETPSTETTKDVALSGSPQSTLCGVGDGCRGSQGSSRGSPNGFTKVSTSPPATWDLLHAAAGEVAKISMNQQHRQEEEAYNCNTYYHGFNKGVVGPPRKLSPVSVPLKNPNPNFGLQNTTQPQHPLSYQKLQVSQFQQLRQQQMMKQQQSSSNVCWGRQTQTVVHNNRGRNHGRSLGLSPSAWPTIQQVQQQPQNQNMRALFLGNPAAKKECAGTGVFLPRRIGTPTEPRKKPACSTVLLPARVVQALNLDLDDVGGPKPQFQPRFIASFTPESDNVPRFRNSNNVSNQKRSLRPQQEIYNEVRLPQDWTY